jgi:hypothetical protein
MPYQCEKKIYLCANIDIPVMGTIQQNRKMSFIEKILL